jgi:metal-responsive CopG/Arc/MetJ family transcriptional regulator
MEEYKRFTVSLPKELYDKFDTFRKNLGISSLSDGVRKAMYNFMTSEENFPDKSGNVVGCISIIFTHEHFFSKEEEHKHSTSGHDDHHLHDHDYDSGPIYANVQQTDEILKNDIQHHFYDIILSVMHLHLEFEKCLELIAVSGQFDRVLKLKEDLQRLKNVLSVGFFIVDKEIK